MTAYRFRAVRVAALVAVLTVAVLPPGGTSATAAVQLLDVDDSRRTGWVWPVTPHEVVASFVAPAHEYGPGHRGIDLRAPRGTEIVSPAVGAVAFAGSVAGRGIVTIDHGAGLVTTLEPVHAVVAIGSAVRTGDVVALADVGGHATPGSVHFGVREDGRYINPMLLLGGIPRAVLLPCC